MALIQSNWAKGVKALPVSGEAGGVVAERFEINIADLPALSNGDIIEIGGLPANHTIVDFMLDNDDLDSGTAANVDIGIMSGDFSVNDDTRTCGSELFDGSTALQGAAVTRGSLATGFRIAPASNDRGIGILFNAAPGTQTTTGKIALIVQYKQ